MPGRFLELGLAATDVAVSMAFYESLGFVRAPVGEAWPHAYAVVTDGRLHLGLHASSLGDPALTFVAPGLRGRLDAFEAAGVTIADARLDGGALDEARFRDPSGLSVRLVEARTYSPPALDAGYESALGWFDACVVGSADPPGAGAFWERLGLVAFEDADAQGATVVTVTHRDLNLEFRECGLQGPVPCFTAHDVHARVAALRDRGFRFAPRAPRAFSDRGAALLQAPDGFGILLLEAPG